MISPGSKKLVIFAHPMICSKSGYIPNEMKEIAPQELDFIKLHKALVDGGYHVIAFDFRNHGKSDHSSN